jgi:hypothetical protein
MVELARPMRLSLVKNDTVRHSFESYGTDHRSPTSSAIMMQHFGGERCAGAPGTLTKLPGLA